MTGLYIHFTQNQYPPNPVQEHPTIISKTNKTTINAKLTPDPP